MGCVYTKDNSMANKVSYKYMYSKQRQVVPSISDTEREFIKSGLQSLSKDIASVGVLMFVRYVSIKLSNATHKRNDHAII